MPNLKNNVINGIIQIIQSEHFFLTTRVGTSVKIPNYSILNYGLKGELNHCRSDKDIASVEAVLGSEKL